MYRGYIALWRKSEDHPFYKERREFSKWEAWMDILMQAQHSEKPITVMFGMKVIICNYGESLKSILTWAKRWHWSESKVRRYLKLLKKMNQIDYQSEVVTTRLTVCNYSRYDIKQRAKDGQVKSKRRASDEQVTTDNNVKHVKKKKSKPKNIFTPPSLEAVKQFFHEKMYKEDVAVRAFDYYENQEPPWTDTNGKQVKSWKSKMISVWFKDENKREETTEEYAKRRGFN